MSVWTILVYILYLFVYAVMSSLSMRAGTPPVFFPVESPWTLAVPGSQQGLMGHMLEAAWMDGWMSG